LLSSMPTIALSAGSACHSGQDKPSSVLLALGLEPIDALGAIRLSLGRWSTEVEVEEAAAQIISTAKQFLPIGNP
jgi:cysteine desulfurase